MQALAHFRATIAAYWSGDGALWKVFWLWGVAGSWLLAGLFLLALQAVGLSAGLYLVTAVVMLAYTAWILVSVWRCAEAATEPWRLVARMLTVAWALNVLLVGTFLGLDLAALATA